MPCVFLVEITAQILYRSYLTFIRESTINAIFKSFLKQFSETLYDVYVRPPERENDIDASASWSTHVKWLRCPRMIGGLLQARKDNLPCPLQLCLLAPIAAPAITLSLPRTMNL